MHRFAPVLLAVFGVFSLILIQLHNAPVASAATASTINFQARLQSAAGAIVPDGTYNLEFKLYSGASCNPTTGASCTVEWTEDYLNSASQGLQTVNGYLSANLGSITAFSGGIKWDQQLWLSMNVGGTTTGSVTWDGAMKPYLNLTAVPAAFSANQLANTTGSGRSTLTFQGSSSGDQNFVIQDQGAAGTYNLLTTNVANSSFIQLQSSTPGTAQTGNINISGTAIADTLQGTTAVKTAAIRPVSDSTTGLQIENAAGSTTVLDVDTTNSRIGIGLTAPTASLDIKGPTSDSSTSALNITNAAGGAIINARDDGQVTIGTTAASGTVTTFGSMTTTTLDSGDNNYFTSTKFTTGIHPGALTSISIYVGAIDPTPANDKYRLAIYADGGANHPTTLIAQSAEGTLTASTFNTLSVTASLSANTSYWLAYQTTTTSNPGYNDFAFASAGTNQYYAYANPYGPFPGTASTGGTNGAVAMAIYGTYTEAGTGTVPALTVSASGNIGVGNSSPIYAFDVAGTGNFSTSILSPQLDNAGALGIGTGNATDITVGSTTSSSTLTLGQSTNSNTINIGNAGETATQTINIGTGATGGSGVDNITIGSYANGSTTTIQGGTGNITLQTNASSAKIIAKSNTNSVTAFQVAGSSSTVLDVDTTNSRVGINNTAPSVALDIGPSSLGTSQLVQGRIGDLILQSQQGSSNGLVASTSRGSNGNLTLDGASGSGVYLSPSTTNNNYLAAGGGKVMIGGQDAPTGDLSFETGGSRTINIITATSGNNGNSLTIQAGSGNGTSKNGGNLILQGGNSTSGGTAGSVIVKPQTDVATAFQVQTAGAVSMLNVDTTTEQVTIGPSAGDSTGAILVLGNKTSASGSGDPTGVAGAMYYNSNLNKFRCYQNGAWANCITTTIPVTVMVEAKDSSSTTCTYTTTYVTYGVCVGKTDNVSVIKVDLTNATQARIGFGASGFATNGRMRLQYSTDFSTWNYLDGSTGPEVDTGTVDNTSSWVNIASGAKADVWIRVMVGASTGTVGSPGGLTNIYAQFK